MAAHKKYYTVEERRAANRKAKKLYDQTEKGKAEKKRYQQSPAGKFAVRRSRLKTLYGITWGDWNRILAEQNGHCALCDRTTDLCVDHDHITGKVRGILCRAHNQDIGSLGDNEEGLLRALAYLRK